MLTFNPVFRSAYLIVAPLTSLAPVSRLPARGYLAYILRREQQRPAASLNLAKKGERRRVSPIAASLILACRHSISLLPALDDSIDVIRPIVQYSWVYIGTIGPNECTYARF